MACGNQVPPNGIKIIMGKGDKQHGNREAKKPKANKKLAPAGATFLKTGNETPKAPAKPSGK